MLPATELKAFSAGWTLIPFLPYRKVFPFPVCLLTHLSATLLGSPLMVKQVAGSLH